MKSSPFPKLRNMTYVAAVYLLWHRHQRRTMPHHAVVIFILMGIYKFKQTLDTVICIRASRKLWSLRKIMIHCTPETELMAYKPLIPSLTGITWHLMGPSFAIIHRPVGGGQKTSLRFISNSFGKKSHVSTFYAAPGLPELSCRRKVKNLIFFIAYYKKKNFFLILMSIFSIAWAVTEDTSMRDWFVSFVAGKTF